MLSCAGIEPAETIELHTRETIREAIAIGVGVSMFYSAECPPDPRIVYLPLGCEVPIQTGYVMCLADQRRTPLAKSVFETASTLTSDSPIAL
jgi:DNA-binding transcriptional LysR family regulator